ncbi:MAG: histidine kinase dimerization/phosphoacceptor domain -containing protein [Bacteroidales bacterium]
MNIFALLSFLSSVLFFQTGVFVLYKNHRSGLHRVLALLSFLFALYGIAYYYLYQASDVQQVYLLDRIAAIGWATFPVVTVWFHMKLTHNRSAVIKAILFLFLLPVAVISLLMVLVKLETLKVFYMASGTWFFRPNEESLGYMVFVAYLLVSVLVVYFMLIGWYYAAANNRTRTQAKILILSLSVFFVLSFLSNLIFPLFQIEWIPALAPVNGLVLVGGGLYALLLMPSSRISSDMIYDLVMKHVREFIFLLNKEGAVYAANSHVLNEFKYNLYDLQRIDPGTIFSDFVKVRQIIEKMGDRVNSSQTRMDITGRDRQSVPVLLSVIKVRDEFGRHLGYILVCIDHRQRLKLQEEVEERLRTEKSLYQIRKELEMLVKKRTFELQEANQRLQQEVVERKRAEQQISTDLQEKITLVQEVHHRVKNNIQMIISLINMLCNHPAIDPPTSERLRDIAEKVRYISRIHEDFYSSPNLSRIEFASYLKKSIGELYSNHGKGLDITFKLNIANEQLEINQAIPLGIIFNELLINAMKYAFPKGNGSPGSGMINVEFYRREGRFQLIVKDNGVGLPADLRELQFGKTGLKLIQILTREHLQGKLETQVSHGTSFKVSFDDTMKF